MQFLFQTLQWVDGKGFLITFWHLKLKKLTRNRRTFVPNFHYWKITCTPLQILRLHTQKGLRVQFVWVRQEQFPTRSGVKKGFTVSLMNTNSCLLFVSMVTEPQPHAQGISWYNPVHDLGLQEFTQHCDCYKTIVPSHVINIVPVFKSHVKVWILIDLPSFFWKNTCRSANRVWYTWSNGEWGMKCMGEGRPLLSLLKSGL